MATVAISTAMALSALLLLLLHLLLHLLLPHLLLLLLLPQLRLLLLRRHRHRRLPLRLLRLLRRSCAREGGRPGQLR